MKQALIKSSINYDDYLSIIDSQLFPIDNTEDAVIFLNKLIDVVGDSLNVDTYDSIKFDSLSNCQASTYPYNMSLNCDAENKLHYNMHLTFLSLERVDINGYCFLVIKAGGFNDGKSEYGIDLFVPRGKLVVINPTKNDVYNVVNSHLENATK